MRINHNMMAINTHRQLGIATEAGANSMEKLSSGYRINKAGDDAAGLSISEKMRNQIRGLDRASSNAQDGISLIQTAEGALDETHSILRRMRELAVQAGNEATLESDDIDAIKDEFEELAKEIDGISYKTEFNGKKLLVGGEAELDKDGYIEQGGDGYSGTLQVGANEKQQMDLNIGLKDEGDKYLGITVKNLGVGIDSLKTESPDALGEIGEKGIIFDYDKIGEENYEELTAGEITDHNLEKLDAATKSVSQVRSNLGASQNRLEHTISNLDNAGENLQAAESRIRDVDMAKEMMEQTRQNILQQASTSMLAQANMAPQNVLQLLG